MSEITIQKNEIQTADRAKIGRNAGIVGICVNILLFIVKLIAGIISGSVSIIADAVNNLTDAGSSVIVLIGYVISVKPADKEHPYGHARMEYLCSLLISVIVTVLGIELLTSSVKTIMSAETVKEYGTASIIIMAAAIIGKLGLAVYYRTVGKKIGSEALAASAADSIGDVFATSAVIIGILLSPVIGPKTDGIFGAAIALYILIMGIKLIVESSNPLIGTAPDIELVKTIVTKLKSYDGVLGIHDLVIHSYGFDRFFASVHLEMDSDCDVMESHDIIDNIEAEFRQSMGIELVIHYDPITVNDDRVSGLRLKVYEIIEGIASGFSAPLSMHDFRIVFGVSHTNIIFDLALSHDFPLNNDELVEMIRSEIRGKIGRDYNAVITIDRDYTTTRY